MVIIHEICCSEVALCYFRKGLIFPSLFKKSIKFIRNKLIWAFFSCFYTICYQNITIWRQILQTCGGIMQHLTWKEKHLKCIFMNCWIFTLTHWILKKRNSALLPVFLWEVCVSGHKARAGCFVHCLFWAASSQQCRNAAPLFQALQSDAEDVHSWALGSADWKVWDENWNANPQLPGQLSEVGRLEGGGSQIHQPQEKAQTQNESCSSAEQEEEEGSCLSCKLPVYPLQLPLAPWPLFCQWDIHEECLSHSWGDLKE